MKNSFHSDNFIFPINAASQVLTLSNIFFTKVPAASDLYEYILKNGAAVENVYWLDVSAEKEDTA